MFVEILAKEFIATSFFIFCKFFFFFVCICICETFIANVSFQGQLFMFVCLENVYWDCDFSFRGLLFFM